MKKILVVLGCLLLAGCESPHSATSRRHEIVCRDVTTKATTYDVVTWGNVYAFVVAGHSVLSYYVEGDKQIKVILLSKNDCMVY